MKKSLLLFILIGIMTALCACTQSFLGDNKGIDFNSLQATGSLELSYAEGFSADYYGEYTMINFENDTHLFLIPNNEAVCNLPNNTTIVKKPIKNVYVAASSVMDMLLKLNVLDSVAMTGTKEDSWHIEEIKNYINSGKIVYAGKYNEPDYEMILQKDCGLAIENTMIYHNPETKEKLEELNIPVMVEQSSKEEHPLGRLEWIKLYGILFDREEAAEAYFKEQVKIAEEYTSDSKNNKNIAFFYINKNGIVNVKKSDDYIPKMIELAGGGYVPSNEYGDYKNLLSTANMQFEAFYAACQDADILVYNDAITRDVNSLQDLINKNNLFKDFDAVKNKNVYLCGSDFYQESTGICELIKDFNIIINNDKSQIRDEDLRFLKRLD